MIVADTNILAYLLVLLDRLGVHLITTDKAVLQKFSGIAVSPEDYLSA